MVEDGISCIRVDAINKGKAQEIAGKIRALQKTGAKRLILDLRKSCEGDESEASRWPTCSSTTEPSPTCKGKYPREAFNADVARRSQSAPGGLVNKRERQGSRNRGCSCDGKCSRRCCETIRLAGDGSVSKIGPSSRRVGVDFVGGQVLLSPSGKAIQDAAVTPNIVVADSDDDAALPDDDDSTTPADEEKKAPPQQDEQLHKAIQVLKSKAS